MVEKKSKLIYTEKGKIKTVIDYFAKYGKITNATVNLPENKKAVIRPYNGKLEIISDDVKKINELEQLLEKNDK